MGVGDYQVHQKACTVLGSCLFSGMVLYLLLSWGGRIVPSVLCCFITIQRGVFPLIASELCFHVGRGSEREWYDMCPTMSTIPSVQKGGNKSYHEFLT